MTVNWDVKSITETILTDHFNSTAYDVDIVKQSEGDSGGSKVTNRKNDHIIKIRNTEDYNLEKADITYSTLDKTAQVFIEIKSTKNKIELWNETKNAILDNRKLHNYPEYNWDLIEINDLSIDDPTYGVHTSILQIVYVKRTDPI